MVGDAPQPAEYQAAVRVTTRHFWPPFMIRLSLRSLFLLMAMCAVAIASFHHASDAWQTAILSVTLIVFCLAAIQALVDRGFRRANAIGCAASMAAYGLALLLSAPLGSTIAQNREFNPSTGRLPTSWLLNQLYARIAEVGWVDVRTGKPAGEPRSNSSLNAGDSITTTTGEIPDRETFMVIGHSWWALILGGFGALSARHIYRLSAANS
jgi:predicted PurR-regulated permease PerM